MATAIDNLQLRSGNELVNLLRQLHWSHAILCAHDDRGGNSNTLQYRPEIRACKDSLILSNIGSSAKAETHLCQIDPNI